MSTPVVARQTPLVLGQAGVQTSSLRRVLDFSELQTQTSRDAGPSTAPVCGCLSNHASTSAAGDWAPEKSWKRGALNSYEKGSFGMPAMSVGGREAFGKRRNERAPTVNDSCSFEPEAGRQLPNEGARVGSLCHPSGALRLTYITAALLCCQCWMSGTLHM